MKHLQWFLEHGTKDFTPSTRYRYWLTVRALVLALNHGQPWLGQLGGPWVRPNGSGASLESAVHPALRAW